MKKSFSVIFIFIIIVTLTACSNTKSDLKLLDKEGIAPYELTEREKDLLQSYGINNNSQIISFNAPKEANSLRFNVYRLKDDSNWDSIGQSSISIGDEKESVKQKTGTLTMILKDNYAIDFNINYMGISSYKTEEIKTNTENSMSIKSFLTGLQEIEINKEIPIALMVYSSGTSIQSYSLQDYFKPAKFAETDLVQVVTVTFTDKELI